MSIAALSLLIVAQTTFAPIQTPTQAAGAPQKAGAAQAAPDQKKDPYEDAIKDYKKSDGMFTLFQKDESILIQIPSRTLGRDMLWITELKQTPSGGFNGTAVADGVVRWEVRGNKVLLRKIGYEARASGSDTAIAQGVAQSNVNPIVEAFPVKAKAPDGSPLIDVSRFFTGDIPEFSAAGAIGGSPDPSRTMLDHIAVFPENLNVYVMMTVRGGGGARGGGFGFGAPGRGPSSTGLVSHSITMLPEKPMQARLNDSRVGYFSTFFSDYGTDYHGQKELAYINRYRLEKKDPSAEISEPIKPITYYLSPEIPKKWREACRQGVEDWNVAFEKAGFKNAIRCIDAPDDPEWSPEDARYSVIRWAPLPIANAMGPSTVDPRSGEIINAHIIIWHDILKLQTEWYFAQASAIEPQYQRLPLPDTKMSELLRFVVAHEVGHTLGLPHNGKSSSTVSIAQLRNPAWCEANGTATSIMDYARFNYVAQPGDGVKQVYPKVGKYDKYSIMWGYTPIAGATTPEAEKRTLDLWAAQQISDPQLRFFDNFNFSDPTCLNESLSNDNVEASKLGTANLKRIIGFTPAATVKLGEDYSELQSMHQNLVGQFSQYVTHVMAVVGGVEFNDYHGGRGGDPFKNVSADYQRRAVTWLLSDVMKNTQWLAPQSITNKYGMDYGRGIMTGLQSRVIGGLWNEARLNRMFQNEAANGAKAYTAREALASLHKAVWQDAMTTQPKLSLITRNMQRSYVTTLISKLASAGETRGYATNYLRQTRALLSNAATRTTDSATAAHFADLGMMIDMAMKYPPATSGAGAPAFSPFINAPGTACPVCHARTYHGHDENGRAIDPCWLQPIGN